MSEARLKLMIANLMVSRATFRTLTASANKRYCNSVTHLPFGHILAHCLNNACQFMTWNMR